MKARIRLIALLLAGASLPCFAQGTGAASVSTGPADPTHDLRLGRYRFGGFLTVDPWALELHSGSAATATGARPRVSAELAAALRLGPPAGGRAGAAGAGAGAAPSVRRDDLDPEAATKVSYDEIPGGIVFGRVARPDVELEHARIRYVDGRLRILAGAQTFLLPVESVDLLRSCLAFARAPRADHVLVDIGAHGTVTLAPEFLDTEAGADLVRCDGVPHESVPAVASSKSVIVDRDVRLRLDPEQGSAHPEAQLEVRFYREQVTLPDVTLAKCVKALPATGALEKELAEGARVAAWIGFFRWALAADPAGTAQLSAVLARTPTVHVPTPRRIVRAQRTVYGEASAVKGWMRLHRAKTDAR